MLKTRTLAATAITCAAATLALAPAAPAAAPEPCGGKYLISDAQGDQGYRAPVGADPIVPAPANADIVGVFFRIDDGKVTANLAIDDLTQTLPSGFNGIRYRVYYTFEDEVKYLQGMLTSSGITFTHGHGTTPGGVATYYSKDGDTTGTVFEGKNGVVQIVIPPTVGGTPGKKLEATSGSIGLMTNPAAPEESQAPPQYFGVDTAPDGAADGPSTTPADCGSTSGGGGTIGNTPNPPNQGPKPGPEGNPQQPSQLRITLAKSTLSARKARRLARLVLKSSEEVTGVTARLRRGSKVVGTAKLARVGSSTALRLKLKRPLKKGSHKLLVTGNRADGSAFSVTLTLKVTR